jgi:hypothetical protein
MYLQIELWGPSLVDVELWNGPSPMVQMPQRELPICPKCHRLMKLALVKAAPGRAYKCIDCEGEDPLRSPDISKLLQSVRPPE